MKEFLKKNLYLLIATGLMLAGLCYFAYLFLLGSIFSPWQAALFWFYFVALLAYLFVITPGGYRIYQQRVERKINSELEKASSDSPSIKAIIRSLRYRARGLHNAARFTLFLTFIAITAGLYIFTAAEQIASRDSSNSLDQIVRMLETDRRNINIGGNVVARDSSDAKEREWALETIKVANQRSATIEQILTNINQRMSKDNLFFFLTTLSTRIGSVLLLIFLVQILLSVYRYSIRLETYYEARADALMLYNGSDEEQLERLVAALSPEKIEFGKSPASPTEHAVEAVKGVASLRK